MKYALLLLAASSALFVHAQPNTSWSRTAGNVSQYDKYLSAADATGHIYTATAGESSSMDFGNGNVVNDPGPVIARYDSLGNLSWARALTTMPNEFGHIYAIAANSEGDLWATGYFNPTTLTVDGIVLSTPTSVTSTFLVRFDSTGVVEFATAWGPDTAAHAIARDLCVDAIDQVYITGYSDADTLAVGGLSLINPSEDEQQLIVLKFDAQGMPLWGTFGQAPQGNSLGSCIATDAAGNVHVVGITSGLFEMDGISVTAGNGYAVLIRLDPAGTAQDIDLIAQCDPQDLAVDAAGKAYVCGYFQNPVNFGGDTLVPTVLDGFVAAYDSDGAYRWVVGVQGEMDNELCWSVDLDAAETALLVGGTFVISAYFGDLLMQTGLSPTDGFIMHLDTAGTVNWVKDMTGDGPTMVAQACLDPWDHLYASGVTQSATAYLDHPVLNGSGNHAFLARFGDFATDIPPAFQQHRTRIYPNPCDGAFTLDLPKDAHTVRITDAQGRVAQQVQAPASLRTSWHIALPGIYFVSAMTASGCDTQRLIVR